MKENNTISKSKYGDDKLPGWHKRMSVPVRRPPPTILMWNKIFGASLAESLLQYKNDGQCFYKCIYTDNRSLEQTASILVFHIRDNLDKMPEHRTPQQLYTFFILESPPHTWGLGRAVPPDFFNISMTYRADSDVYYPYDMFEEYTKKDLKGGLVTYEQIWTENEIDKKIKAKDKLALQIVSNCNTKSLREKYVNKLKDLIQITQIGTCSDGILAILKNWITGKRACNEDCADKLIDSHHFYFAFENSVCVNYVTEKFWRLKSLIVPVVLSRKIFEGLNIPNDSFIAADDFKSPKDLASFLEKLAADKKRYKSYFRWTKKYKKTKNTNNISNPLCNLCKMAHINNKELKIKNIYDFWNGGGKCQQGFALNVLLASEHEASGGNVGLIISIVIVVVVLLAVVGGLVWFFVLRRKGEEAKGMEMGMTGARGMKTNKVGATQAKIGGMTTVGGMQAKTGGATTAGRATSKAAGTTKGGATSKAGGATSTEYKNVR